MAARPVIGICACVEQAKWAVWDDPAVLVPRNYVDAVQRAGGLALVLAPDPVQAENPDELLDLIDGLMLIGGTDLAPEHYGAERHPDTDAPVADRDAFELALAARAMERDLPFLGICRGMQVMNVAAGGTLTQHLPDEVGHTEHRRSAGTFEGNDHEVELAPGSLAARAAGETEHVTLSHHHQGIDEVGKGFTVTGRDTRDDLPEAIEIEGNRYTLGVQWHPEADEESKLIASLVEEARRHADEAQRGPPPSAP